MPQTRYNPTTPEIVAELTEIVVGEHGIGYKRKECLPLVMAEQTIELVQSIKRGPDQNNILNPGRILTFEFA